MTFLLLAFSVNEWRENDEKLTPGLRKYRERKKQDMWARAIAVWLLVMVVEFVHGMFRWIFVRPHVGDFRSGQIGIFTGSVLFLLVVYFCEPWMKLQSRADCARAGLLWVGLTFLFEWNFGHYVMERSWESISAEYNLLRGGLMPIGLAIFAMSPWIAWRVRGKRRANRRTPNSHGA